MNPHVDLSQLSVRRPAPPRPAAGGRGRLVLRYVLPGLVLLGFVAVTAWAARDSLLPARPVTVVPVLTTRAEVRQEGAPLFQAAGWVEPRPTPTLVTSLAEGVVDELLVVEGQEVKKGETVIARLNDRDARLALETALSHLRAHEADVDMQIAKADVDLKFHGFQCQAAAAARRQARTEYELKKNAAAAVPQVQLHKAENELAALNARYDELAARREQLEREVVSLRRMRDAFRRGERAKPGDAPPTEAEAAMEVALAHLWEHQVAVDVARLRLERMTIKAPADGRVLSLIARPGTRLMGLATNSAQEASTVVSLYDPARLQVRADVLFEHLPHVVPGQPVRIESPALGGPVDGEVLFSTSLADVQKNTLQVKVRIVSPPPVLKPDMLVQLTFLAPKHEGAPAPPSERLRLLVPRPLVESGEGGAFVWLADQAARQARRRAVKLGPVNGELVEVVEGLNAADKLIAGGRDGLTDGARINVSGEDTTLGVSGGGGSGKSGPARLATGRQGK